MVVNHLGLGSDGLGIVLGVQPVVLYCDWLVPGSTDRVYAQAEDIDGLLPLVEEYLLDYNAESHNR